MIFLKRRAEDLCWKVLGATAVSLTRRRIHAYTIVHSSLVLAMQHAIVNNILLPIPEHNSSVQLVR